MIRTFNALTLTLLLASTSVWAGDPAATTPAPAKASSSPTAALMAATPPLNPGPTVFKAFEYEPKPADIVFGKADAPVTMVEYASLSCPHCAAFYKESFAQLQKNYIDTGKIKFVYRNYPLNQPALEAAEMVQCADKDARPTFLKVLFTTQEKWAYDANYHEAIAGIALLGGMSRKAFDECMKNKDIESAIVLGYQDAKDVYKVTSTPTLFVESDMLKGNHSYAAVSKALDDALAAKAKK